MRYQERVYIQNQSQNLRNKDILNVNMSSDFCIFEAPLFTLSGGTKVLCDEVTCEFSGITMSDYLTAATANCVGITQECVGNSGIEWSTKIYEDGEFAYSATFMTTNILTGDTLTNTIFVNSVNTGLSNLAYTYTRTDDRFDIEKKFGIDELKIDICINFNTSEEPTCPSGYTLTPASDSCQRILTTGATLNSTGSTISSGDTTSAYGELGAKFYTNEQNNGALPLTRVGASNIITDQTGTTISAIVTSATGNTFWDSVGSASDGRLNNIGISASSTQFVGFSECVDIDEAGTYYVGLAADNFCKFSVDNEEFFTLSGTSDRNHKIWHVFPFEFTSGKHIIEMLGKNDTLTTSFGAEIYNPTDFTTLTGATNTTEAGVIFTTADKVGQLFDLGDTVGFSCPTGYALDTCVGGCLQIDNQDVIGCPLTGTCDEYCDVTCNETFLGLDSSSTGVYVISTATTIDVVFDFTANTDSFSATNATFKYEVYQYNHLNKLFQTPAIYKSDDFLYNTFVDNTLSDSIPLSGINLDGEYLVKGYYIHDVCTDFLSRLGERIDSSLFKSGDKFGIYDADKDFYFLAMDEAKTPLFIGSGDDFSVPRIYQQVIIPPSSGQTIFNLQNAVLGEVIVSLNGLTLAKDFDWSYIDGTTIQLSGVATSSDIIAVTYTTNIENSFTSEVIDIIDPIVSGVTNGQGSNNVYFNTSEGKYEIFTDVSVLSPNQIILNLNGVTLAGGVDYYLSITDDKRIILEGSLLVNDLITLHYISGPSVIHDTDNNNPLISWYIESAPQNTDGRFVTEVSSNEIFTGIISTAETQYISGVNTYSNTVTVTGSVGTELYYRVRNEKDYISIKGDKIESTATSEIVPITITSNSLNSY